jgi:iron complex outermembrane receptor protein
MNQPYSVPKRLQALAVALAFAPGLALAQSASNAASTDLEGPSASGRLEEVTVTARKRVESELDVPIAISALTSKDIYQNGISSLADISLYTPGVALDNDASDHVSRQFQSIFIRGMVETSLATPNVSVFIDGAPVSAGFIPGVEDAERVEILKGPQSAFFGRETFAGAVNIVTKAPAAEFSGSLDALYGNDDWYDIKGSLEGPISDVLSGRVTFRDYSTLGQYKSSLAPYTDLGAQGTKSLNIALTYKPNDSLTVRPYLTFWNDDDGPAPAVKFNSSNYNCNAGAGTTPNYICGTLPTITSTNLPVQGTIDNLFRSQVFANAGGSPAIIPLYKDLRASDGFTRDAFHGHLIVDWQIPDSSLTLTSVTSGNVQESEDITTLDDQNVNGIFNFYTLFGIPNIERIYSWFARIQTYNYDFAQEFRLSSDQSQPLRWTGGVNYAKSLSSTYVDGLFPFGVANFGGGGPQTNETAGIFGSVTYDITAQFSATLEGRGQTDTIAVYNRTGTAPNTLVATNHATDFLPRASVQYKFTPDAQVYFTYSRGVNPGSFNTDIVGIPPQILQEFETLENARIEVKPEYLQNFELGVKGRFLDGRLRTATDVYFDEWTHQILNQFVSVPGIPGYDAGAPDAQNVQVNGGDTHLYGLETDVQFQATHALVLSVSGAINRSIIETYPKFLCNGDACTNPTTSNPFGYTNIDGHALPNAPEFAANAAATYTDKLTTNLSWFGRADYIYKSSEFTDLSNLTKIGANNRVNFRVGLFEDKTSVELFVLNAFNNKQYTSVNGTTDIDGQPNSRGAYPYAVIVGPPVLRQFGIRARYHF